MGPSDPSDFDAFYEARAPSLVRTIYLRTGDVTRAEDCVQEAFIRAWRKWDRLNGDDPVGWVTTVAWRLAIRAWRRSMREAVSNHGAGSTADPPPRFEELVALRDLLGNLPTPQGDVLLLHYLEDLSVRDVSKVLGMREGTIKSHLSRGRANLQAAISEKGAPA